MPVLPTTKSQNVNRPIMHFVIYIWPYLVLDVPKLYALHIQAGPKK